MLYKIELESQMMHTYILRGHDRTGFWVVMTTCIFWVRESHAVAPITTSWKCLHVYTYSNEFAMKPPTVRNLIAVSPNSLSLRTCLHVGYFFMLLLPSPDFFKINFLIKLFQEYFQSAKRFDSRSRPTFYWSWSESKLFAKFIRRQK